MDGVECGETSLFSFAKPMAESSRRVGVESELFVYLSSSPSVYIFEQNGQSRAARECLLARMHTHTHTHIYLYICILFFLKKKIISGIRTRLGGVLLALLLMGMRDTGHDSSLLGL